MLVIEHNLDVIKTADWIIDLGPEGGDGGGQVVVEGTPEKVAKTAESHTGRFLGACSLRGPEPASGGGVDRRDVYLPAVELGDVGTTVGPDGEGHDEGLEIVRGRELDSG